MRVRLPLCTLIGAFALAACSQAPAPSATPAGGADSVADASPPPSQAAAITPAQQSAWAALLARMDRDGDGVVARGEHAIAAAVMFARMDRDGDDKVTVEEMDSEREQLLDAAPTDTARRLADVDANHDGALDSQEHDAATRVVFDRYDRNSDAKLARDEFLEALAQAEAAGTPASPATTATAADSVR
jgi:Ca2+-binding EF-hand superfamily protein